MIGSPFPVGLRIGDSIVRQEVRPGTVKRILSYTARYRCALISLLIVSSLDAAIAVGIPLLLGVIIDSGIEERRLKVVVVISLVVAGLALLDAAAMYVESLYSAKIGEGIVYDLRTTVFDHVQRQPLAFFTRAQTGSLVSRLSTDIIEAQKAVTSLLAQATSSILTLLLVLGTMFYLSWQISIIALVLIPFFVLPGKFIGKKLQLLTREEMRIDAELGSITNERCNVAGAMLSKLYGRPEDESFMFASRARRLRDVGVVTSVYGRSFFIIIALIAALGMALAYGLGGDLVIAGALKIGTLVALITLLARLYAPINQLSNLQVNVMTALVSFDRLFEVLDLSPLIAQAPDAYPLPPAAGPTAPAIEFDHVWFRYPAASTVSLPSLETIALPAPERADDGWVLMDVSFRAPTGQLTALVGLSGAGKTTISHLVPRLYDPSLGTVSLDGHDLRELTLRSVHDVVGVITQDAHLFHDTLRGNLLYAQPEATEREMIEACKAARIWDLIGSLPDRLDTVVGDRGFRLSGGERQRVALARLLLKGPSVVVLDEATAHLDSKSEAAIRRALATALAGRTSLVIAHRLSTVREADQILVVDAGQIIERGTHEDLLLADGRYAELYRTQFAQQAQADGASASGVKPTAARQSP